MITYESTSNRIAQLLIEFYFLIVFRTYLIDDVLFYSV